MYKAFFHSFILLINDGTDDDDNEDDEDNDLVNLFL